MSDLSPHALATTPAPDSGTDTAADLSLEIQAAFVQTLAQWGNVGLAAQQVGVSRQHLYRMRRASDEFRELWDAALVLARPQVEEVLADRALNGVTETVFYHGEEVATRTRYDARLLLAHLGRLDRLEGQYGVKRAGQEFDARLDRLLNPPVIHDWDDDEYADEDYEDDDYDGEDTEDNVEDGAEDGAEDGGWEAEGDGFDDEAALLARLRGTGP